MSKLSPSVMVSSTLYDLRQVRTNLAAFISNELGYLPLLSELPSFPVGPDADTVENCRRRVVEDADIFVLIVGGRYGTINSRTAKSITNVEYLSARAKGIPIFVFIDRAVLPLVSVWQRNPTADFGDAVDNSRVLAFIHEIRDIHKVWTHEFGTAQDIIEILRMQLAYLMREGLALRQRLSTAAYFSALRRLHGESLRIALEKPDLWEYRVFAHVLKDQILAARDLRKEYDLALALGLSDYVSIEQLSSWANPRLAELKGIAESINSLVNRAAFEAFGPPGQPGDVDAIVFVAERLGEAYRRAIEWAQQIRRASVDEDLDPVLREMAEFSYDRAP